MYQHKTFWKKIMKMGIEQWTSRTLQGCSDHCAASVNTLVCYSSLQLYNINKIFTWSHLVTGVGSRAPALRRHPLQPCRPMKNNYKQVARVLEMQSVRWHGYFKIRQCHCDDGFKKLKQYNTWKSRLPQAADSCSYSVQSRQSVLRRVWNADPAQGPPRPPDRQW